MGFDRDLVARGLAAQASSQAEEALAAISSIPKGLSYKGQVDYYADLPSATAEVGDCYTVKYTGSSGTNPDGSEYVWGSYGGTNTWIKLGQDVADYLAGGIPYLTTAPTNDNTNGRLQFVVLSYEPEIRYNGYIYIITESNVET